MAQAGLRAPSVNLTFIFFINLICSTFHQDVTCREFHLNGSVVIGDNHRRIASQNSGKI